MDVLKEITLPPELVQQLADTYDTLETDYARVAGEIHHTCSGCPDNCCDSYFLHYTYAEWAYLWIGLNRLDTEQRDTVCRKAEDYMKASRKIIAQGGRPQLMCPLNEDGLCTLYEHRLMICRLHGIPATMNRPDGQQLRFPGCFRCQELVAQKYEREEDAPAMNRTPILMKVATIENDLLGGRRHLFPKVKLTIAEMICNGPPRVDKPFCEK